MRVLDIIRLAEAFFVYATVEEAAREAGQVKERAMPPPLPRQARWPSALLWSRTNGLQTLLSSHMPSGPGPGAAGFIPPAETGPEEQAGRGCH
jgi:hypothetical protein